MVERTLLIVDDSPSIRGVVRDALAASGLFANILEASDGEEGLRIFFKNKIDFIITDVMMPKVDGYKFVSVVKASDAGRDVPVIMLSADRKEIVDKIKGLDIGASDYLIKPFDRSELLARINVFVKIQELQNELKEKNVLLERLSVTDELTGLYNRRYFYGHIKMHVALAKRHAYSIGCLIIDIDHFKDINDAFGHDIGDKVLKEVAGVMQEKIRDGEVLARFGGEEFIICLCRSDTEGAISAAERIRKAVEGAHFLDDVNNLLKVTVSIGITTYPQEGLNDSDDIIRAADEALYRAKRAGRNKAVVYSLPIAQSKKEGGAL